MMSKIDGGLRKLFRDNLPQFDWCSIESGTTGGGIPDSNYCTRVGGRYALTGIRDYGVEGWIEHKQTTGHAVTMRPEQIGWILRRVRHGGRVWIAVRQQAPQGPRREARDVLWLIPGAYAKEAKMHGLGGKWHEEKNGPHTWHTWHNGPSAWDWLAVATVLTS